MSISSYLSSLSIKKQKYAIILVLLSLNTLLSVVSTIYNKNWYIFICILGLESGLEDT